MSALNRDACESRSYRLVVRCSSKSRLPCKIMLNWHDNAILMEVEENKIFETMWKMS